MKNDYLSVFLSDQTSTPDLTELNGHLKNGYRVYNEVRLNSGVILILTKDN